MFYQFIYGTKEKNDDLGFSVAWELGKIKDVIEDVLLSHYKNKIHDITPQKLQWCSYMIMRQGYTVSGNNIVKFGSNRKLSLEAQRKLIMDLWMMRD